MVCLMRDALVLEGCGGLFGSVRKGWEDEDGRSWYARFDSSLFSVDEYMKARSRPSKSRG